MKQIWPTLDGFKKGFLLHLTRSKLKKLVATVPGRCRFDPHAYRLGIQHHDYCRSCQNIDMVETTFHILCQCPEFEEAWSINIRMTICNYRSEYWWLRPLCDPMQLVLMRKQTPLIWNLATLEVSVLALFLRPISPHLHILTSWTI